MFFLTFYLSGMGFALIRTFPDTLYVKQREALVWLTANPLDVWGAVHALAGIYLLVWALRGNLNRVARSCRVVSVVTGAWWATWLWGFFFSEILQTPAVFAYSLPFLVSALVGWSEYLVDGPPPPSESPDVYT